MKKLDYKRATLASILVWVLGVTAFSISYFIPIMENPEEQANLVLVIVLIPLTLLGARFYYKKGNGTNGLKLGLYMFLLTIVFDASITVPILIMPYGGTYQSFFGDIHFWLIGFQYVSLIAVYWLFTRNSKPLRLKNEATI